ncbi:acetyltransferase [Paracrocinitomix mangrovi]|uniref:acetyltransferase n=1 Tax=Paracrocinitomix mangrovi TaxID=2862509 RepID=UPI001C8D3A30|nr:acetyltransferase [Paracrocinitomix mangrovi]UKN01240.1 acetyltransferase [Paracrocinitomix mangrovi]
MLIIGTGGFATETLEVILSLNNSEEVVFYDNIFDKREQLMFGKFQILHTRDELSNHLRDNSDNYVIGVGNPQKRKKIYAEINDMGGKPFIAISAKANVGHFNTTIGQGTIVCGGTQITNNVKIGKGCLINLNVTIGHDTLIEDFVEICPGVNISGNCKIGEGVFIGTSAVILPGIKVGEESVIGAGAVVTKDVKAGTTVVGIPAKQV